MSVLCNKGQQRVIDEAILWNKKDNEQVFEFSGGPGTGKSFVLHRIIQALGIKPNKIAPMAYTGAAAIVMRLNGFSNAKTAHSWLYNPVNAILTDKAGVPLYNNYFDRPVMGLDFEPKSLPDVDYIIIDEAGSIPYSMKYEIEKRGKKIIATGDIDQLPPVDDKPAYLYNNPNILKLTEIMRQEEGSAIVYISQRALLGLPIHKGFYGNVLVIDEDELTNEMISNSDIVICGKNSTRDAINNRVRHEILKINSDLPMSGEQLVCRKNNWFMESDGISLANGLVGNIINCPDVSGFDGKTFTIDFMPKMLNTAFFGLHVDFDYFTSNYERRKMIKNNKYNTGEKFEFAYACTAHIAQGSQYANGIYIEEYLNKDINKNLNYVGASRFRNSMIYVRQKIKKYYSF